MCITTLTISIPDDVEKQLQGFCDKEHSSFEQAICDILRRQFRIRQFQTLGEQSQKLSKNLGYDSEDDLLRDIS